MCHTTLKATPDATAYRQLLRIGYTQVRQRLARTATQLEVPDADAWRLAADALPGYIEELRRFVQTLTVAPERGEPTLAVELADTYWLALRVVEERLASKQPTSACQLANRLLDVMALELSWMSAL